MCSLRSYAADEFDILFWVKWVKPAPQAYRGQSLRYQIRFAPPMSFPKLHPCGIVLKPRIIPFPRLSVRFVREKQDIPKESQGTRTSNTANIQYHSDEKAFNTRAKILTDNQSDENTSSGISFVPSNIVLSTSLDKKRFSSMSALQSTKLPCVWEYSWAY